MSNKSNKIDVSWLAKQIGSPSIYNIVYQISRLIERKEITAGALLPTIRELAKELVISPTTVATAFSELKSRNIVRSKRGVGTEVVDNPVTEFPQRFAVVTIPPNTQSQLYLNSSLPDNALLPPLEQALLYAAQNIAFNKLDSKPIIPELQTVLAKNWPYPANSFMATNNPHEVITHLLTFFIPANSYVAIENPASINELDKLSQENVRPVAVDRDKEGPIICSLAKALAKKPAMFIYQPREHIASGETVSKKRIAEMAALFKACPTKTLIIELDIIGDLSTFPAYSIGEYLPEQTVYIRSYLRTFSGDLNFIAASGPEAIIQQLCHYRLYNLGCNSQFLQCVLAHLLRDKNTWVKIKQAQTLHSQRYKALLAALKIRHIYLPDDNLGALLFLWLPVRSEKEALSRLIEQGVIACGGSHFMVIPQSSGKEHIRIMTSQLSTPALINQVADAIAFALLPPKQNNKVERSYDRINRHPMPLWGKTNKNTKTDDTSSIA